MSNVDERLHEVSLVDPGEILRADPVPSAIHCCLATAFWWHRVNTMHSLPLGSLVVWNIIFLPSLYSGDQEALRAIPGLRDFLFIEPMFRHEGKAVAKLHLGVHARTHMVDCLEAMSGELLNRHEGYMISARSTFLVMLVHLARSWTQQPDSDHPSQQSQRTTPGDG